MTSHPILSLIDRLTQIGQPLRRALGWPPTMSPQRSLTYWAHHAEQLPDFVQHSTVAMHYVQLLGVLDWERFPERDLQTRWTHAPVPYAPFVAACLVKLDRQLPHMSKLRQFLVDNPALLWVLGFPLVLSQETPWGFDADRSLPTPRHFTRLLRHMPNDAFQFVLTESVQLLQAELKARGHCLGQSVSLDTKHIIAWVSAPWNDRLYCLSRDCGQFTEPARSPPSATRETKL